MKVLFLVGGLGSNRYLFKFLQRELSGIIDIKQPARGYTSIMRGALIYEIGQSLVSVRSITASFGICVNTTFKPGDHPENRKYTGLDGRTLCEGVMFWYLHKGQKVENGKVFEHEFQADYLSTEYNRGDDLWRTTNLYICDEEFPPEYDNSPSLKHLTALKVNLRELSEAAFYKKRGPLGEYRRVAYQIGLSFGAGGVDFTFTHQGRVVGYVSTEYS